MKFINYINEIKYSDNNVQEIISTLKRDCKPYLSFLEKHNYKKFLKRFNSNRSAPFELIVPRTDRKPRDTPDWVQKLLDKEFKKKFGVAARSSGVFCKLLTITEFTFVGSSFGSSFAIFPVGAYDCIWAIGMSDLYLDWSAKMEEYDNKSERKLATKQWAAEVINKYTDDDIGAAYNEEIMLICSKYYAVRMDLVEKVLKGLKDEV